MHLGAVLLSLVLPLAALGHPSRGNASRHQQLAKRATGDVELHKRFSSTRWTFYDVGLGACGKVNVPTDFIVALNSAQYGGGYPGPNCFKSITMTYNGKTATATIMDECPGCPYGGLDLSRGLFKFFAPESVGVLTGDWHFNDGAPPPPPPPPPKPKPTTTKHTPPPPPPPTSTKKPTTTWKPAPTTTSKPQPTTTTRKLEATTSSTTKFSSSTHISSSSSSVASSSTKSSSTVSGSKTSVVPTPSVTQSLSNLQVVENVFGALGEIALAGVSSS